MGPLQRFERKLEGAVGNTFARIFKGKVHPAEIARALTRDADENKVVIGVDRILVPNTYTVRLSPTDYSYLVEWERQLSASLSDMVREHLDAEGLSTYGRIKIKFDQDPELRTGVFEVDSKVDGSPQTAPPYAGAPGAGPAGGFRPAQRPLPPVPAAKPADAWAAAPSAAPTQAVSQEAPAKTQVIHYVVIDGPNTRIPLSAGNNVIGRGTDARVKVSDTGVSRQHADLVVNNHGAVLQDLQSTNGTLVNGRKISSATLRDGDVIKVGHSVLVYRSEPAGQDG